MSLTLFLVEDSAPVRERIEATLATIVGVVILGHAAGAEDAIRCILELRPHVVLLDLRLAQGSGFDVLRGVLPKAPEIEFYMLSNFATPAYRRTAEQLGARGFFDKSQEFPRLLGLLGAHPRLAGAR